MLNRYAWWKYLIILAVIVPGLLYALPNLYGDAPGVQVRGTRTSKVDSRLFDQILSTLKEQNIATQKASFDDKVVQLQFSSTEIQIKAKDVLEQELGNTYTVALTLLAATPGWLSKLGALPMYLGLDLRGGVHFLMEVDLAKSVKNAKDRFVADIRAELRHAKIHYVSIHSLAHDGIEIKLRNTEQRQQSRKILSRQLPELSLDETERDGATYLIASIKKEEQKQLAELALNQNITSLRNRIDELGVAEPVVQRQGDRRIVVQLPGVQDTARAKRILGRTATLEMMMVDEDRDLESAVDGRVPPGSRLYKFRDGRPILLKKRVIYSGENIVDAAASLDTQTGGPIVSITLDAVGAKINQRITGENIGKRMAVVYIESRSEAKKAADGRPLLDEKGNKIKTKIRIQEVITAPVIRDQLGKRFQIEGLDSAEEARDLALLLRAGALAAPVDIVEERTVGPSLGQANISQGFQSVVVGFVLVLIFMGIYYRLFGLVADLALAINLVLIVAVLSFFQATLTLPGVAGIVLTVGMAVDANVLIFERIREELRNGNSPQASIHVGYDKALSTIVDANITTLIAAIVLFNFGTGPIKGFAITLSIGILTSMFTAIMGTRGVINLIYGGKRVERLAI